MVRACEPRFLESTRELGTNDLVYSYADTTNGVVYLRNPVVVIYIVSAAEDKWMVVVCVHSLVCPTRWGTIEDLDSEEQKSQHLARNEHYE